MSRLTNVKSNENIIYSYLAFHVCRQFSDIYENCLRTGTAGLRNPTQCYEQSKLYTTCAENKATKLDPISLPIFNDVRECLFQNDSHIFNCKEELNQLVQSHVNPQNYKQMLLVSTPYQRQPKRYNTHLNYGGDSTN